MNPPAVPRLSSEESEGWGRQRRNLLLARPILQMEVEKGLLFKDDLAAAANNIDTQALALAILDFITERTVGGAGAPPEAAKEAVAPLAMHMAPELTEEQARTVVGKLLGRLGNASDGYRKFNERYYDPELRTWRNEQFALIEYKQASLHDEYGFHITNDALTVHLAMLQVRPILQQEASERMLQFLLERRRFDDALEVAQAARGASRDYQVFLHRKLVDLRRDPRGTDWIGEVLPKLAEAQAHLTARQEEEALIIERVEELKLSVPDENRADLLRVERIMRDCQSRHRTLFRQIMDTNRQFYDSQLPAFRVRGPSRMPDPETEILLPLLRQPMSALEDLVRELDHAFLAPTHRPFLHLRSLLTLLLKPRERDAPEFSEEEPLIPVEAEVPRFPAQLQERVRDRLQGILTECVTTDVGEILSRLDTDEASPDEQICALMQLFASFETTESLFPSHRAQIAGRFSCALATGSNLEFEPAPEEA